MLGNISKQDIERIADKWIGFYGSFSPTDMSKSQRIECWARLAQRDGAVCRFMAFANDFDLDNAESCIQTKIAFQKRKAGKAAWIFLIIAFASFLALNDESAHLDDIESQLARESY